MDIKTQKMLADVVLNAQKKSVQPYTTTAKVKSVADDIVYVEIPGSDRITPVKSSSVAVKKGDIVDLAVSHSDTHITGNRSDVATPQSSTKELSQAIEATRLEMDNELDLTNNKIKMVNNDIEMMDNTITMQGNTITEMNNTIDSQNNTITQQGNSITEINNTVTEVNNKVESQGNTITQINNTITQQGNTITEMGNKVNSQSNTITEMNDTITSQGNTITQLDNKVTSQGNTITQMNDTVTSQGNTITQQGNTITEINSTIETLNSTVETQGSTIQTLDSSIQVVNSAFVIQNGKLTGISEILTNILDSDYVTTDLLNADVAWIENGKIKQSAIGTVEIADSSITTAKIAELSADVITTGTLKTECLILTTDEVDPETGKKKVALITALNAKTKAGEGDVLDGAIIKDNTIEAAKITVVDLNAFGATIGNFHIGTSSMYNNKTSLTDPTNGVYIGTDGIALGQGSLLNMTDDSPFRVESDGDFHLGGKENNYINFDVFSGELDIDAKSIKMGSSTMATVTNVNDAKDAAISAAARDATAKANQAKSEAVSEAATDATNKADAAKSGAISTVNETLKKYATLEVTNDKISTAVTETKAYADSEADAAVTEAKSYTDQTAQGIESTVQDVNGRLTTMEQNASGFTWSIDETAIVSSVNEYYKSTSPTSLAGGSWSTAQPTWTEGAYIWMRAKNTNGKGVSSYTTAVCITGNTGAKGDEGDPGADGRGISNTTVTYQAGSSGTTVPTGTWSSSVPSVSAGQYLWTKTVTTYTSGNPTTAYSVGRMGTNGQNGTDGTDGKGIKSTAITYQAWSSGTTTPTGTWSTSVPSTTADRPYLWTKTVITYTDNTTSTSYSVGSTPEGIVVGSRNLLLNTNKGSSGWSMNRKDGAYTVTNETMLGVNGAVINIQEVSTSWSLIQYAHKNILFTAILPDTHYTISFDVWSSYELSGTAICIKDPSGQDAVTSTASLSTIPAETWTRVTATVKTVSTFPTISDQVVYWSSQNKVGTIKICNLKLEKGNKATDWTPAPEDIEQAIEDVEVGGQNLLSDTNIPSMTKKTGPGNKYLSDSGNADYSTGAFVAVSNLPVPGFTHVYRFTCTTASSTASAGRSLCFYSGATVPMINGQEYTMSMYARKTSGNGKIRFMVGYSSYPDYNNYIDVTSEWKRYSYTFTYSDSATGGSGGARAYFGASCAVVGVVETFGWKLERGNKATDWSLSVEAGKTATNYMNFSDEGLVVGNMTASTLGRNVLIDNDSVDIRNGSEVLASYGENIVLRRDGEDAFTIKPSTLITQIKNAGRYLETANETYSDVTVTGTFSSKTLTKDLVYIWHINNVNRYAVFSPPSTITITKLVYYKNQPAYLSATVSGSTKYIPCAYADENADTELEIDGSIWINSDGDANGKVQSIPPLGIGISDGVHLEIDNNEVSAKSDNITPSNLNLNMEGGAVTLNNNASRALKYQDGALYSRYAPSIDDYNIPTYSSWYEALNVFGDSAFSNIRLGYGTYSRQQGSTQIYGNNIELNSRNDVKANNGIVLANGKGFQGTTTGGDKVNNFQPCNTNNHCMIGYGNYDNSRGDTNIYGNNVNFTAKGDVHINGNSLLLDNNRGIYSKSTSGEKIQNFQPLNSNNNCVLGYGSYSTSSGDTNVYGHNVSLTANSTIKLNTYGGLGYMTSNRSLNILWSGGLYMGASHTASLSESVANQLNGIVLVWSKYSDGEQNYEWNCFFIPKQIVTAHPGGGHAMYCLGTWPSYKYVYVNKTSIAGSAANNSKTNKINGVTVDSTNHVLRYVIGV